MPAYFFDSSALVKRYVQERGTDLVLQIADRADWLVVSHLTVIEVTSAVVRRRRSGGLTAEELDSLLSALDVEVHEVFGVVGIFGDVVSRATDLVRTHSLRAADAVQLACALKAAAFLPKAENLLFVSADAELNSAAEKEGFEVINPSR